MTKHTEVIQDGRQEGFAVEQMDALSREEGKKEEELYRELREAEAVVIGAGQVFPPLPDMFIPEKDFGITFMILR